MNPSGHNLKSLPGMSIRKQRKRILSTAHYITSLSGRRTFFKVSGVWRRGTASNLLHNVCWQTISAKLVGRLQRLKTHMPCLGNGDLVSDLSPKRFYLRSY